MSVKSRCLLLQVAEKRADKVAVMRGLDETESLVRTYGGFVVVREVQYRDVPDRATYVGSGKVGWLREVVKKEKIDVVILNGVVQTGQIYRLEKELWEVNHLIVVWDRVDLILNIFEQHASTMEAKLQIELARIKHVGPRVYGLGRSLFSRQGGGVGTRGLGETNVELERRRIKAKTQQIEKQLKRIYKQKESRLRHRKDLGIGPVALVGYTSAGKTSLFNVLTGKHRETNLGLFTTLDTVVGKLKVADSRMPILVSDTIGFIADLPPSLIEAFKSTLLESLEARLLLHVVDASDAELEMKVGVVNEILDELGAMQPRVLVLNKTDLVTNERKGDLERLFNEDEVMWVSALDGDGISDLKKLLVRRLVDVAD